MAPLSPDGILWRLREWLAFLAWSLRALEDHRGKQVMMIYLRPKAASTQPSNRSPVAPSLIAASIWSYWARLILSCQALSWQKWSHRFGKSGATRAWNAQWLPESLSWFDWTTHSRTVKCIGAFGFWVSSLACGWCCTCQHHLGCQESRVSWWHWLRFRHFWCLQRWILRRLAYYREELCREFFFLSLLCRLLFELQVCKTWQQVDTRF